MTRSFAPDPLDLSELIEVLDLARRAPSAGFSQGTHFLVLDGDDRQRFWQSSGAGEWFQERASGVLDAPVIVVPLAERSAYLERYSEADKDGHGLGDDTAWTVPHWLTDTALAVQQLLLLAEDRGWGALYAGIFRNVDAVREEFSIPDDVTPIGFVALGHRATADVASGSPLRRQRRPLSDLIHRGGWGGVAKGGEGPGHGSR